MMPHGAFRAEWQNLRMTNPCSVELSPTATRPNSISYSQRLGPLARYELLLTSPP